MEKVFKYNMLWQLTRVNNKKEKCLQNKLQNILAFINTYPSNANKARVLNYLDGLSLGYKNINRQIVNEFKTKIQEVETDKIDIDIPVFAISTDKLIFLYKDLYKRNDKWLKNNYRNIELNHFLIQIYNELYKRQITIKKNFDIYPKEKSKQKFIF